MQKDEYYQLVKQTHSLITSEIKRCLEKNTNQLMVMYPKFVIMYQFFRMLRGEAFLDIRPNTPEYQNEYYQMQNDIRMLVEEVKSKLDSTDEVTNRYVEDMKKKFNFRD